MSPLSVVNKTFPKTERTGATKQRSNSRSLVHSTQLWTDRLGCLPFFSEGDRINSKLVYAVPKINLIQKGSGGQRHHLPCPLRQIIAKIVSTLCTQKLKLETLTIQYSKGFCCLVPRTVLLSRHCPSAEEDDSWQVEASPSWQCGLDVLEGICVKGNPSVLWHRPLSQMGTFWSGNQKQNGIGSRVYSLDALLQWQYNTWQEST